MFLRNFFEVMRINSIVTCWGSNTQPGAVPTVMVATDGTAFTNLLSDNVRGASTDTFIRIAEPFQPLHNWTLLVGTGTTAPDIDDYSLEADVTSSFTSRTQSINFTTNEEGHFVVTIEWTGTNNTGEDITITEIGARKPFTDSTKTTSIFSSDVTDRNALMMRYILDNPVTIPASSGGTINVKIEMF